MGNYDPLGGYLKRSGLREREMTFPEIERVIGATLPKSAQFAAMVGELPQFHEQSCSGRGMDGEWLSRLPRPRGRSGEVQAGVLSKRQILILYSSLSERAAAFGGGHQGRQKPPMIT